MAVKKGSIHMVIPDLQVKPNTVTDHIKWISRYMVEYKPDKVIQLGDLADFPSLSSYDRGKKDFEGRRFNEDVKAARKACKMLMSPLYNSKHADKCETHILHGNHEFRSDRFAESNPEMYGFVGSDQLRYEEWFDYVHPFLQIAWIDGVGYSHYYYSPMSGKPYGGVVSTILKNVGFTFIAGHRQGFDYSTRNLANGTTQHGIIAGSCYLHHEKYLGPQQQNEWRGILILHEVENGDFDLMKVSLNYLCRKYENKNIDEFLMKKYGRSDGYVE